MLLFMGGCAGSTAGAMKAVRVLLFAKQALARAVLDRPPAGGRLAAARRTAGARGDMHGVSTFMGLYLFT